MYYKTSLKPWNAKMNENDVQNLIYFLLFFTLIRFFSGISRTRPALYAGKTTSCNEQGWISHSLHTNFSSFKNYLRHDSLHRLISSFKSYLRHDS